MRFPLTRRVWQLYGDLSVTLFCISSVKQLCNDYLFMAAAIHVPTLPSWSLHPHGIHHPSNFLFLTPLHLVISYPWWNAALIYWPGAMLFFMLLITMLQHVVRHIYQMPVCLLPSNNAIVSKSYQPQPGVAWPRSARKSRCMFVAGLISIFQLAIYHQWV